MKFAKIAAFMAIALLAVVCIAPVADASSISDVPEGTVYFDSMNGGSIKFTIDCDKATSSTVITVTENGKQVYNTKAIDLIYGENNITVKMSDFKSPGDHQLKITCSDIGSFTVMVHVNENILSKWTTYAAIIIAALVIVIIVYLKMRDTPKQKSTMTFEQLEAEKQERKASKTEKVERKPDKAPASSTERKKYKGKSQ